MLRPYLKIWEWEGIFGGAVKAIFPLWASVVRELHHQFDKLDDKKIGISKKFSCTHDQENLNYTALKSSINQE